MIPQATYRKRCKRCHKLVLVPKVSPCQDSFFLNGIWVSSMEPDGRTHHFGFLCFECAFETEFEEPMFEGLEFSMGFCGGEIQDLDNWDAIVYRKGESQ